MNRIKVALVDNNRLFLKSMSRYLNRSKDILVVGTATTKEEALKIPAVYDIDVALINIALSKDKCDGIFVANQILTNDLRNIKVIMITESKDKELIRKSFIAGAVFYVLKTDYRLLPDIIRKIYTNNFPVETVVKEYADFMKGEILKSKYLLSDTEILIYKLVEKGSVQSEIIERLYISESTYKKHVNSILKKLNETRLKRAIDKFNETILR